MTGEAMQDAIRQAYATPKPILQRAIELHGSVK